MSQIATTTNQPTKQLVNQRIANQKLVNQRVAKTKPMIVWQDLRHLSRCQVTKNILFPLPFLGLFWFCVAQDWWLGAFAMAFFSFSACLRLAHDGYHRSLGLPKVVTEGLLFVLSGVLFCSTHAIRHTHLQHHREALSDSDIEGVWARLPWYVALFAGIVFTLKIQWAGLIYSRPAHQKLVIIDLLIIAILLSVAMITMHPILLAHIALMTLGNMLVGFFGVWLLHHDLDEGLDGGFDENVKKEMPARSERNWLVNALTFGQFYHREHHLYPAVPTDNLYKLAQRLDGLDSLSSGDSEDSRQFAKPIPVVPFLAQTGLSMPCLSKTEVQQQLELSIIKVKI